MSSSDDNTSKRKAHRTLSADLEMEDDRRNPKRSSSSLSAEQEEGVSGSPADSDGDDLSLPSVTSAAAAGTGDNSDSDADAASTAMVRCEECGHEVPIMNMDIHRATRHHAHHDSDRGCSGSGGQNQASACSRPSSVATADGETSQPPHQRRGDAEGENDLQHPNGSVTASPPTSSTQTSTNGSARVPTGTRGEETPAVPDGPSDSAPVERPRSTGEDGNQWPCPRCTLLNPQTALVCDACQLVRSGAGLPMATATAPPLPQPMQARAFRQQQTQAHAQAQSQAQSQPEVQVFHRRLHHGGVAATVNSVLSGAILGSFLGGAVGAVVGAAGGALMDLQTRRNIQQAEEELTAEATADGAGAGSAAGPAVTYTSRRIPGGGMQLVVVRSNGGGGGGQDAGLPAHAAAGMSPVDQMILRMLLSAQGGAPNPDGMSYEELLRRFGVGTENRGATQEAVDALPMTKFDGVADLRENEKTCGICLEDFQDGDEVRKLPACSHSFHRNCIDRWLPQVASCPICKKDIGQEAAAAEKNEEEQGGQHTAVPSTNS